MGQCHGAEPDLGCMRAWHQGPMRAQAGSPILGRKGLLDRGVGERGSLPHCPPEKGHLQHPV